MELLWGSYRDIIGYKISARGYTLQNVAESQKELKEERINQIYDKILKRILTLSTKAVVNLINGLFNTNFPQDSTIVYNWTESIDDKLGKTISDTILRIHMDGEIYRFHIETT